MEQNSWIMMFLTYITIVFLLFILFVFSKLCVNITWRTSRTGPEDHPEEDTYLVYYEFKETRIT